MTPSSTGFLQGGEDARRCEWLVGYGRADERERVVDCIGHRVSDDCGVTINPAIRAKTECNIPAATTSTT